MNLNPTGWTEAANPTGGEVIGNNSLDMPTNVTFKPLDHGQTTLVSDASYGPNKSPASITFGNNTSFTSTFNDAGMPDLVRLMRGGTTLYDADYSYDGAGNITAIASTAPAVTATFGYDALNRLTSAAYSSGTITSYGYEYDAYGNMLIARQNGGIVFNKTYLSSNRISGYSYDNRGNFISSGVGNICYWDAQNRLQYIQNSAGTVIGKYLYDDRGLRLSALPPLPEIAVKHDAVEIPSGGEAYFTAAVGQTFNEILTIRNLGDANLSLGSLTLDGDTEDNFDFVQPSSPILPGGSANLAISFHPRSAGHKVAVLHIPSNDVDEADYVITLCGNYVPEIEILQAPDGGDFDYGEIEIGQYWDQTFTIRNYGEKDLILYGDPVVFLEGDVDAFEVISQPYSPPETPPVTIAPGGTRTFVIRFSANSEGLKTASFSIVNSDWNENPYDITLTGTGIIGENKAAEETAFVVTSPSAGDVLTAGAMQTIAWRGATEVKGVRLEYSADNGTTYRTIVDRAPNTGSFEWLVPPEVSGLCLVRVSASDGAPAQGETLSIGLKLKIPSGTDTGTPALSIRASFPDPTTMSSWTAELSFTGDFAKKAITIGLNAAIADGGGLGEFLDRWHPIGLILEPLRLTASLVLDGKTVLDGIPLVQGAWAGASPEVQVRTTWPASRIEDFEARYKDLFLRPKTAGDEVSQSLAKDSFEGYDTGTFPASGGWRAPGLQPAEPATGASLGTGSNIASQETDKDKRLTSKTALVGRKEEVGLTKPSTDVQDVIVTGKAAVDDADSATGLRSLFIATDMKEELIVLKRLSLPARVPFGVSQGNFAIGANEIIVQNQVISRSRLVDEQRHERERREADREEDRAMDRATSTAGAADRKAGPGNSSSGTAKMMSASPVGNFYIYSFDGKLLQVYDVYGSLLKDYIYMGDRLIAEYDYVGGRYLYCTPDQINTTRVVTDGVGNVVYSAVYDPYGGIQQTGAGNSYDPQLKFSGKERDAESELDYFGARYYDRSQYRFISLDPGVSAIDASTSQQYSNLYSYCLNNPILGMDPDGREVIISVFRTNSGSNTTGIMFLCDRSLYPTEFLGRTWELRYKNNERNESCIEAGVYTAHAVYRPDLGYDVIQLNNVKGRSYIQIHPKGRFNQGCITMVSGFGRLMSQLGIIGHFPYFDANGRFVFDVPITNGPILVYVFWFDWPKVKVKQPIPIISYESKATRIL